MTSSGKWERFQRQFLEHEWLTYPKLLHALMRVAEHFPEEVLDGLHTSCVLTFDHGPHSPP